MKRHLQHLSAGLALMGVFIIWLFLGFVVSLWFIAVPVILIAAKFIGILFLDKEGHDH